MIFPYIFVIQILYDAITSGPDLPYRLRTKWPGAQDRSRAQGTNYVSCLIASYVNLLSATVPADSVTDCELTDPKMTTDRRQLNVET